MSTSRIQYLQAEIVLLEEQIRFTLSEGLYATAQMLSEVANDKRTELSELETKQLQKTLAKIAEIK